MAQSKRKQYGISSGRFCHVSFPEGCKIKKCHRMQCSVYDGTFEIQKLLNQESWEFFLSRAAFTKPLNNGCGLFGLDFSSG